jgi:hypothetical protein
MINMNTTNINNDTAWLDCDLAVQSMANSAFPREISVYLESCLVPTSFTPRIFTLADGYRVLTIVGCTSAAMLNRHRNDE